MSSSWFHSSSSSHRFHEVRTVHSYEPYLDDDDDVKPAVMQRDYAYGGVVAAEDVKPAKLPLPRPGGGSVRVKDERRDYYADGGVSAVEDIKPAKQPRPCGGAGGGSSGVQDDHQTVLSWPMVEQFKSTLRTQEALAGLRTKYSIPEGFGLHLAATTQAACAPPPPPARGARGGAAAAAVPICVHTQAFAAGLRLPLHPFVNDALTHFGIAPSQLAPNGWRSLVGFAVLCHFRGAGAPTLPVFRRFFTLATLPNGKGWYSFRARENAPALFTGYPTSIKGWKEEFLLVSPPPGTPWRCPVKWGVPTKEAMSDPVLTGSDDALVRRLSQGQSDLKTFLSESNLVAAKISRATASLGAGTSEGAASRAGKKAKMAAGGNGGDVLRSELLAKEAALSKAKGEISQLKKELGNAKKRELAKAQQELAYAAQVLIPEGGGKGAGASKRRRGAQ